MIDLKPILYAINHELLKKKDADLRVQGLISTFKRLCPEGLSSLDPKIEEGVFIKELVAFLYELKGKIEEGQKGIDEAYILQGQVEAFSLLHYCYKMEAFRSLSHHLGLYADSWPAKFAIKKVLADIDYLLMEYRFFKSS
jgi:hypothetical protein